MPLESSQFLDGLTPTNPVGATDPRSEGDDHLRLLKTALKNTFPGMSGRAWRTVSRPASTTLGVVDNMTVNNAAVGITLTLDSSAVLGNGWMILVRTTTAGTVNIGASQNINGAVGPFVVAAGHTAIVFCNGTEFFASLMYNAVPSVAPAFPAGTRMLFQQTTAPTGWTKQTNSTHNNAALRMTTGVVGTGGTDDFTVVFAAGRTSNNHTLTIAQMPSHSHSSHDHAANSKGNDSADSGGTVIGGNTGAQGGGTGHSHGLPSFAVKYVDIITAQKD